MFKISNVLFRRALFVYAFPDGMLDAFADVLGLAEKRDLIRRVTSHEEVEKAISQGLIPIVIPNEISERFSSIPPFQRDNTV